MSRADIADVLGVAVRLVERYEDGASTVPADRLQLLAKLLLVPIDFFFRQASLPQHPPATAPNLHTPQYILDYLADADGLELTRAFVRIPSEDLRRAIVRFVERLAGFDAD